MCSILKNSEHIKNVSHQLRQNGFGLSISFYTLPASNFQIIELLT
jgi:hypothetical protein